MQSWSMPWNASSAFSMKSCFQNIVLLCLVSVFVCFHQEQPTEHFHIHIQFSQDSPHHTPDNNWIQEVLFCFWKGSRLSWETPWHRIVLMLWLCSPWSRNSSETSLTLIRRSSKALPLKRQEEQSFCTGSRKKKCFLYVLSPDCFLCIVVTNLMKITYLNYETKRKTPDSFYVHSYLLYG